MTETTELTEQQRKQDTFNAVWAHSKTMTHRSYNAARQVCMYRNDDGNKCFFGALIPDERYETQMEGNVAGDVLNIFSTLSELLFDQGYSVADGFINGLQGAHDRYFETRQQRLTELAGMYQLTVPE
ncbi:hypothetical protein [Hymenobacter siberiensis]|uniref:hypothetical protein n=1 Tax=Hymenobacter siberiensis TaxID=2848396 RepID=UPI001C1DFCE5|nr:hypothetical protein [Hymenobacter siberiensis]